MAPVDDPKRIETTQSEASLTIHVKFNLSRRYWRWNMWREIFRLSMVKRSRRKISKKNVFLQDFLWKEGAILLLTLDDHEQMESNSKGNRCFNYLSTAIRWKKQFLSLLRRCRILGHGDADYLNGHVGDVDLLGELRWRSYWRQSKFVRFFKGTVTCRVGPSFHVFGYNREGETIVTRMKDRSFLV